MNLGFKVICKMIPSKKEKERKRRRERESGRRWVGKSGTICSHAGRQAVFEIGSERLQTKGEKGGRQFELVVETEGGGDTSDGKVDTLDQQRSASHSRQES